MLCTNAYLNQQQLVFSSVLPCGEQAGLGKKKKLNIKNFSTAIISEITIAHCLDFSSFMEAQTSTREQD